MYTTKVITGPKTRWMNVNVFEPKSIKGSEPKYRITLLIPKDDKETIRKINEAIKAAYEDGKSKLKGKGTMAPPLDYFKSPLQDGDKKRSSSDSYLYRDCYYINASSKMAPGIVDLNVNPITDRSQVYSGCYGRASISFYAYYINDANRGITCTLNNLQKVEDGEPLKSEAWKDNNTLNER